MDFASNYNEKPQQSTKFKPNQQKSTRNQQRINNRSTTNQQKSTTDQQKNNTKTTYNQQSKQHIPTVNSNIKTT